MVVLALLVSGCHEQWGGSSWGAESGASSDDEAAQANVRAAIPAIEAYYIDNGTYEGATLEGLRATYDAQIPEVALFTGPAGYCVESTIGGASYFNDGPGADIVPGHCGNPAPAPSPPLLSPEHTDAEAAILNVVPAIEAFHADSGTYAGLDSNTTIYGMSLSHVRIFVRKNGTAYCVEAPRRGASAHFVGPGGPLAPGPC